MQHLRETWKASSPHSAADMLMYCVLRAINAKSNDKPQVLANLIYKCFTPKSKLATGSHPWDGVYAAATVAAVYGSDSRLYGCLETTEERTAYRKLLLAVLRRSLKLNDKSFAYFLLRQDVSREQQVIHAAHAAMLLGRAIGDRRKPIGHLSITAGHDLQFMMFGAKDEAAFLERMDEMDRKVTYVRARQPIRVGDYTRVQIIALCTAPMRASVMRRRRLFEGCDRLIIDQ